ncbi:transmembrane protein 256 homolog [Cylas formicarius]|uniref:transmembrane protein 256 homolog n=1 Tax=Cylas formicarius TaxID=197179 RepID=UPI002958A936|nr:transmembrane protein 256 homolog [Cylas formicarius]
MGFYDFINFVVYDNPLSKSVTSMVIGKKGVVPIPNVTVITEKSPLWKLAREGGPFVRIAALMGASAVALGAYGAHRTYAKDKEAELKQLFETANRYHFFHSLALFAVPLCRNPKIAGTLIISGTVLFSGTIYYHAFTGENKFGKLTPFGGTILILGWLSMVITSTQMVL